MHQPACSASTSHSQCFTIANVYLKLSFLCFLDRPSKNVMKLKGTSIAPCLKQGEGKRITIAWSW